MASVTNPASTHQSRPPLASRIRASFEGKRSKSVNRGHSTSESQPEAKSPPTVESNGSAPTKEFLSPSAQDGDTLRKAIDQAINSEAFQGAIAAHLARLIKPSIKSALDTIQPLVEAVYTHELLLRKTNQNMEYALGRMEDNTSRRVSRIDSDAGGELAAENAELPQPVDPPVACETAEDGTNSDLDQFKQLLQENNARIAATLAELSSSLEASNGKIAEVAEGVMEIKASLGPTKESVDALKVVSAESNTTIAALQTQLDQLKTDIAQILEAVRSDLCGSVQALHERGVSEPETSFLSEHMTKLDAISTDLAKLKGQSDTAEKIGAISTELAALKTSVEGSIASNTEGFTGLEASITNVLSAVEGHTSLLGEIKNTLSHPDLLAAIQKSNDSHASHTAALGELKERSFGAPAPAIGQGGSSPGTTAALDDLKSDLAALKENIETGLNSHTDSLGRKIDIVLSTIDEQKALDPGADILAAVKQSNESHASHAAALENLKSLGTVGAPSVSLLSSSEPENPSSNLDTVLGILDAHTQALNEIKEDVAAEILTSLHDLGQRAENVSSLLVEIREADVSEEVLTMMHGIGESATTHTSHLESIKDILQSSNAAHGEVLDEFKLRDLSASEGGKADLSAVESQIASMIALLEDHKLALGGIKDTAEASHDLHIAHSTVLDEIKSRSVAPPPEPFAAVSVGMPNFEAVETKLDTLATAFEENKATLSAIQYTSSVSHASHTAVLDELKSRPVAEIPRLDGMEGKIDRLRESLDEHKIMLASMQEAHSTHTASLDELKSRSPEQALTLDALSSGLEGQISGILASLEEHKAMLTSIQETYGANPSSLDETKYGSVEPAPVVAPGFSGLESQVGGITTSLEEHKTMLASIQEAHRAHRVSLDEIKSRSIDPEHISTILSGLEEQRASLSTIQEKANASHDIQLARTISLDEIKSRPIEPNTDQAPNIDISALDSHISGLASTLEGHNATLSELKKFTSNLTEAHAVHTGLLTEIKDSTAKGNESHASHTTALRELKSIEPASPDLSAIEGHLGTILSTLESQTETLSALKETTVHGTDVHETVTKSHELLITNHELLASHTGLLSEIQESTSSLTELKTDLDVHGDMVKQLHSSTAESHSNISSALAGLAAAGAAGACTTALLSHDDSDSSAEILSEVKAVKAIIEGINANVKALEQHGADIKGLSTHLESIDGGVRAIDITPLSAALKQHDAKLDTVHERVKAIDLAPLSATQEQHCTDIKAISAQFEGLHESIRAIDFAPVHAAFGAQGAKLGNIEESIKAIDLAPLSTALEQNGSDIKGLSTQLEGLDGSVKAIDLSPVHAALEQHSTDAEGLSTRLDGLDTSVKAINLAPLREGIHLNDIGLEQLKSHFFARQISKSNSAISEGAWFRRSESSSPILGKNNPATEQDGDHARLITGTAGAAVIGGGGGGGVSLPSGDGDGDMNGDESFGEQSEEVFGSNEAKNIEESHVEGPANDIHEPATDIEQGVSEPHPKHETKSPEEAIEEHDQSRILEPIKEIHEPSIGDVDPTPESAEPELEAESTHEIAEESEMPHPEPMADVHDPEIEDKDEHESINESSKVPVSGKKGEEEVHEQEYAVSANLAEGLDHGSKDSPADKDSDASKFHEGEEEIVDKSPDADVVRPAAPGHHEVKRAVSFSKQSEDESKLDVPEDDDQNDDSSIISDEATVAGYPISSQHEEDADHLLTMTHATTLPSETSERSPELDEFDNTSPLERSLYLHDETLSEYQEKPEVAGSPVFESLVRGGEISGVEDPFSDAQTSKTEPPSSHAQVQHLPYSSPHSPSSPMSESHDVEQALRETAASHLGSLHEKEIRSRRFNSE